jgi:DNA (cytosine-5)-methyltransferase 1
MRPRLLDLFCGAGGAAMGYHRAGFEVVGVDIKPQPHYPFEFVLGEALEVLEACDISGATHGSREGLAGFDAIHASPPCQHFIRSGMFDRTLHTDLLTPTRHLIRTSGVPWVIENVPGAPMRADVMLCGTMFGLEAGRWQLYRHRWFEFSEPIGPWTGFSCHHNKPALGVYGNPRGAKAQWGGGTFADWRVGMEIDWMDAEELSQAIPPAYTEWIGTQLLASMKAAA